MLLRHTVYISMLSRLILKNLYKEYVSKEEPEDFGSGISALMPLIPR